MAKIKILFIIPSMKNAGPVNVCLTLINNLPSDYNVTLLSLGDGEKYFDFKKKSNVYIFKKTNLLGIVNFIYKGNFDIIHSHCTISDIYNYLHTSSIPKLTTIHNYFDVDFVQTKGWLRGTIEGIIGRHVIKKFTQVACSNSVKEFCIQKYKLINMQAIANGVDIPDVFVSREYSFEYCKDATINFYYLGVLNKRKNVDLILQSFLKWSEGKNAVLNIIGGGVEENNMKNKYQNKKIIFHGMIEKPHELFSKFDCFVSASRAEGLPLALIESMSLGKTFICSNIEPHKEVYNNSSGCCGFLFDGTIDGLIKCFEQYYNEKNKGILSANAKQTYLKYYTGQLMSKQYDRLYKKMCNSEGFFN